MPDVLLKCRCGEVQGVAIDATDNAGIRFSCHCKDCQAFAHYLGRSDTILDEYAATDVLQVPSYNISLTRGSAQLGCIRLSKNGLFRWFALCCHTPIGTTMSAKVPFCDIIHCFIDDTSNRNKTIGAAKGYLFAKNCQSRERRESSSFVLLWRMFHKNMLWKIKQRKKLSPFFDANGDPVVTPDILD
jgi:hypothetical protein